MNQLKIIGVYLAAGKSSRFGSEKLLAPLWQKPLGTYALESAIESRLDRVVVVSKKNDQLQWIPDRIHMSEKCMIKTCASSDKGLSYSLKCGLLEAEKLKADAIIVILADQPLITSLLLNRLIINYFKNPGVSFVGVKMMDIITPLFLSRKKYFSIFTNYEVIREQTTSSVNNSKMAFLYKVLMIAQNLHGMLIQLPITNN